MRRPLSIVTAAAVALAAHAVRAEPLTVDQAIRAAWQRNPALQASASQAEAARADASRARDARLPTLSLAGRGVRTDEPMMAFGLTLDQARITQADFDPARLNHPAAVGAWGAGATLTLPVFMGGRLLAGQRAAGAAAEASAADHARRQAEMATAVVEAYFASQAGEEGVRYASDLVAHATETERFVRERNAQGLALDADLARASAFRAQAEAERAAALQRRASARSALALLAGEEAATAELSTPVDALPPAAPPGSHGDRPDLRAARLRRDAADAGVALARGSLLPALFAQASADAMRTGDLSQGTSWTTVGVLLKWDLSLGDAAATRAAAARARAARSDLAWRERQAEREIAEGRRAVETADARVRAAQEAVAASESARTLRDARHRQGLLPLTDVLDAEAGLAGARALLLASRLEARVARARLALALDEPIEGLLP
ncbi:MAG TPA: TolC family protein [Anaeromyxobacter sp.]|nr:TolC family protein [Anaeromyxobacter sp.]